MPDNTRLRGEVASTSPRVYENNDHIWNKLNA